MRERQREGEPEKRSVFFGLLQPWRELGEKGERLQRGEIRLLCPTLPQETRREEKGVEMRGPPRPGQDFLTAAACDMKGAGNTKS